MAKLTYSERKAMSTSEFALPGKRHGGKGGYPIEDAAHARNALARVAQRGTPSEKAAVRAKVHARYPAIGREGSRAEERSESPAEERRETPLRRLARG